MGGYTPERDPWYDGEAGACESSTGRYPDAPYSSGRGSEQPATFDRRPRRGFAGPGSVTNRLRTAIIQNALRSTTPTRSHPRRSIVGAVRSRTNRSRPIRNDPNRLGARR